MLKIKSFSPKTPLVVGNYFKYTQYASTGVDIYKLTAMSDIGVTFAWWDESNQRVQYAKNWCTIEEFKGHLGKGHYEVIPECQVKSQELKDFTHATDKV